MNLGVYPCRPWKKYYLTAAGYLSGEYKTLHGKWHRGEDINALTGGDSDFGTPVQSMFPGTVLYAESPLNSGWGGIVLVRTEHWLKEKIGAAINTQLDVLDIQYAHLHQITVEVGDLINAGDHVGSIGKGGRSQYIAHLHLEARKKELPAYEPQGSDDIALQAVVEYTIDPKLLFALSLTNYSTLPSNEKCEINSGRLYINDGLTHTGHIISRRVEDKLFVKSVVQ